MEPTWRRRGRSPSPLRNRNSVIMLDVYCRFSLFSQLTNAPAFHEHECKDVGWGGGGSDEPP